MTTEDGYLEPLAISGKLRPTPAYDVESTLDSMSFLDPMVKAMTETGFGVFSFDHEGGDGQVEFDFDYAPALVMADRLTLFRLMAKQIAKQSGLLATFMPKPYTSSWGSGAHFNMSLADPETGKNLFQDDGDPRGKGWSKTAYGFVAGILRHAPALAAICNPTVNSYKRLQPRLTDGTISWAPVFPTYGDNNRSCMLRLPRNRPAVENRAVDSAANPYLAAAFLLAAGLEGVAEGLDPGEPVEDITYDWTKATEKLARLRDACSRPSRPSRPIRSPTRSSHPAVRLVVRGDEVRRVEQLSRDRQRMGARDLPEGVLVPDGEHRTRRRAR